VYALDHVDQAIELLCGTPAGAAATAGSFDPSSVNGRVEARLAQFASHGAPKERRGPRPRPRPGRSAGR